MFETPEWREPPNPSFSLPKVLEGPIRQLQPHAVGRGQGIAVLLGNLGEFAWNPQEKKKTAEIYGGVIAFGPSSMGILIFNHDFSMEKMGLTKQKTLESDGKRFQQQETVVLHQPKGWESINKTDSKHYDRLSSSDW